MPQLFVEQRRLELGSMLEGDMKKIEWTLENRGTADLVIEDTKETCGCTVVELSDAEKTIPPGGSLNLRVVFNSTGRLGPQNKGISVFSNDLAEPKLKLSFSIEVQALFEVKPMGMVNLQAIQRGQEVRRTIDFLPSAGRTSLEILDVSVPKSSPVTLTQENFVDGARTGKRLRITIDEDVAIGRLMTTAKVKLAVDGIHRTRELKIRGEVIGDLTWNPKILDNTRQRSHPGKRFAPVRVKSENRKRFEIISATADPLFDVKVETPKSGAPGTSYVLYVTLKEGAPAGPFGETLEIRTNLLSQPIIEVPIFGTVADLVGIDPPIILLRQDGTPRGQKRRVKLQVSIRDELTIQSITCDIDAIHAEVDSSSHERYRHLRWLNVELVGKLPKGLHQTSLVVRTSKLGAQELVIPVSIEVP